MSNNLKRNKQIKMLNCLIEGCSVRATGRLVGSDKKTVLRLLNIIGEKAQAILDEYIQGIDTDSVELDEIWAFVGKKQKRCTWEEDTSGEYGDQYTFVALDADTKLAIAHTIGKRNMATTREFIADLSSRLADREEDDNVQLSSDGFRAYADAIEMEFGLDVDYGQVIKEYVAVHAGRGRYSPPAVTAIEKRKVLGNPLESDIGTSYVERQNLTMRMSMRRMTRLTNAFSKKLDNLKAAVALHFFYYNFCRIHRSLEITPAMAAGVTDRLWDFNDLLDYEASQIDLAA